MLREYRLDMRTALADMSWRRLLVLLRGLSPYSATVIAMRTFKRTPRVFTPQTPEAAQRAFVAAFAPAQKKPD